MSTSTAKPYKRRKWTDNPRYVAKLKRAQRLAQAARVKWGQA